MKNLSVMEWESLAKVVGSLFKEQFGDFADKDQLKKAVEDTLRDILAKSAARGPAWALNTTPMNPMDVVKIEKALYSPAGEDEVKHRLQNWNDDLYILMAVTKQAPEQLKHFKDYQEQWSELAKALNTQTAGAGLEWIPTGFSNKLIEMIELESQLASLFDTIQMPTDPYTLPTLLGHGTAYKGAEPTDAAPPMLRATRPTTGNLTLTGSTIIANYPSTDHMTEDSIIPVLPLLKKDISICVARADDDCILNGDLSAAHMDTGDNVQAYDAKRCWNGLRALCMSTMKITGTTWSSANGLGLFRAIRTGMRKYGLMSRDLRILANTSMMAKFKDVAEVLTVDKIGNRATIIDGEIDKFDGVKIIPTEHYNEFQNVSGVYDGITVTTTGYVVVFVRGFIRGMRRELTLEYVRRPEFGINYLVASTRRTWRPIYDTTTEQMIGWQFNVTR